MKKYRIVLAVIGLLCFDNVVKACDVCGCTAGGNLMGILPQFHRNFAGLRYSERSFTTVHPPLFSYDTYREKSEEKYQTIDIWGRFYPTQKIQILGFVPINHFSQRKDNSFREVNGAGDVQLLANYVVFDNSDSLEIPVKQVFLLGGGIKLPTGQSDMKQNGVLLPQVIQLGSGSWDWNANAIYTIRVKKMGLNLDAMYKINGTNSRNYHFGNRFTASARLFYWARWKGITFLPQVGLFADAAKPDRAAAINPGESGGFSLLGTMGTDIYLRRLVLSGTIQPALQQNIGLNYTKVHNRFMVSAVYLF